MDFEKVIKELDERFNLLEKQKQELLQRVNEIAQEQLRLQGEYRLLQRLKEGKNANGG